MKYKFFTIPVRGPDDGADEMNRFLAGHRTIAVDRHLIPDGAASVWTVCITYDDQGTTARALPAARRVAQVDYREKLTEPEFAVYSRLRDLRKTLSDAEGIQAYYVFTNEQMAKMVSERITTLPGLLDITGVGESRAQKYGSAFLKIVHDAALPPPVVAEQPLAAADAP